MVSRMKTEYKVQGWGDGKYHTLWVGHDLNRAIIQSQKPYVSKYYSSVRIVKLTEEVISIYKFAIKRRKKS